MITVKTKDPKAFAKRMFYLTWQACGGTFGLGCLKDIPAATEDQVFDNVVSAGDYCGPPSGDGLYADYVFGRMIKWGCRVVGKDTVEIRDKSFSSSYQGFSRTYRNNKAIVKAAGESLGVEFEVAESS